MTENQPDTLPIATHAAKTAPQKLRQIWASEFPCRLCKAPMERSGSPSRGNMRRKMRCTKCPHECVVHPIAFERIIDGIPVLFGYSRDPLREPERISYRG